MTEKHLWEIEHPYYWNEGCFYARGGECHENCASWEDFLSSMGDADPDLNLLCRWDWDVEDEEGNKNADGNGTLQLGFVAQRKAYTFTYHVKVSAKDEPAVRKWLANRWTKIQELWAPFSG